jgi:ribose transport system permease protein
MKPASPSRRHPLLRGEFLRIGGPLVGLLVVVLLFSFTPGFLTAVNMRFICTQTVIVAIAALGMTMIIVSGGIDLSVGSMVALNCVVPALVLRTGGSIGTALAVTLLVGAAGGLFNGLIIALGRLNPFIVTLGMMGIVRGVVKWLAGNQTVNYPPESVINRIMNNPTDVPLWIPPPGVLVAIVLAAVFMVLMNRTVFGRHIYAIGSNASTARLCGVRVERVKLTIYLVAGIAYAVAGIMQVSRLQQGSPTVAVGLELDIIAAVVIGGASLSGGVGTIGGTMIGALIMACLRNGTQLMGWPNYVQELMIGAIIILAVGLDKLREWYRGRKTYTVQV